MRAWILCVVIGVALAAGAGCTHGKMKEDPQTLEAFCAESPEAPACRYLDE